MFIHTLEFSCRINGGCLLSSFGSEKYRGDGGERSREFVVRRRRQESFHIPASLQCHHRTSADDGEAPLIISEDDCDNYLMLKRRSMISLLLLSSASTTSFASASAAEAEEPTECQNGRIVSGMNSEFISAELIAFAALCSSVIAYPNVYAYLNTIRKRCARSISTSLHEFR